MSPAGFHRSDRNKHPSSSARYGVRAGQGMRGRVCGAECAEEALSPPILGLFFSPNMNDSYCEYIALYCCVFRHILNIGQYGATWISIDTTADIAFDAAWHTGEGGQQRLTPPVCSPTSRGGGKTARVNTGRDGPGYAGADVTCRETA